MLCVDNQLKNLIHISMFIPLRYLYYGTQKFSVAYTLIVVIYVLGVILVCLMECTQIVMSTCSTSKFHMLS